MNELRQSTQVAITFGPCVSATDFVTELTSLAANMDGSAAGSGIMLSINGSALVLRSGTPITTTYDKRGHYKVTLKAADVATLGPLRVDFDNGGATMIHVWQDYGVITAEEWDRKYSTGKGVADLHDLASADITTALQAIGLHFLAHTALGSGSLIGSSLFDLIMNKDATNAFNRTKDSLQALYDNTATAQNLVDDLLGAAGSSYVAVGTIGKMINDAAAGSGFAILDKLLSGHNVAGTVGEALTKADTLQFDGSGWAEVDVETIASGADFSATMKADLSTAAQTASQFLDTLLASHNIAGSAGSALMMAGSAMIALLTAIPEPASLAAGPTPLNVLRWLWSRFYKKSIQNATQQITYKDDGSTPLATRAVTDDGTTQTLGSGS